MNYKYLIHFLLFPVFLLPKVIKRELAYLITLIWYYLIPKRYSLVVKNIKSAFPDCNEGEIKKIAFESTYNLARTLFEFSYFPYIDKNNIDKYVNINGLEHINEALNKKSGILILGTHMGNGDFSMFATCKKGYDLNLIYRPVKNKFLEEALRWLRSLSGLKTLLPKNSSVQIVRALKRNQLVVFVSDQFTRKPIGIKSQFFGQYTGTNSSLASFALKLNCPVIPAYSYRDRDKICVVYDKEIVTETPSDNIEENILYMTEKYNRWIESVIKKYPNDWMWVHNRWKKI